MEVLRSRALVARASMVLAMVLVVVLVVLVAVVAAGGECGIGKHPLVMVAGRAAVLEVLLMRLLRLLLLLLRLWSCTFRRS